MTAKVIMPKEVEKMTARKVAEVRKSLGGSTANLLSRLQKNAEGTLADNDKNPIEMTAGQIKSAEILLKKTMPDLQTIDSTITQIESKSGAEIQGEAISFLMKAADMSEEEARNKVLEMAKEAMN